jgi:hypothetical protein
LAREWRAVIVRLDRTIQYAAASRFIFNVSGILGRPVKPDNDDTKVWRVFVFIRRSFAFPRRNAPELYIWIRPEEGAGNAGCPVHPQPRV